ncbi:hypothetical protein OAD70_07145, partial [Candidatus Pelagibacter sp.]|nr:hypothetical protein [Candidatus Pelagibacter sp.]
KTKILIVPNSKNRNNFQYIDEAALLIGNDSTLCYESFGRGNKVFFFGIRGKDKILKSRNFAYPLETLNESTFWNNTLNFTKVEKSLKKLIDIPDHEWKKYFYKYKNKVMNYNFNNLKIKKYLNENKIS